MVSPNDIEPFEIRFSPEALEGERVTSGTVRVITETLEYFARECARRLGRGGSPSREDLVPIVTLVAVAECTFDDFTRTITVTSIDPVSSSGAVAADAVA